jgi:hypothetical protein
VWPATRSRSVALNLATEASSVSVGFARMRDVDVHLVLVTQGPAPDGELDAAAPNRTCPQVVPRRPVAAQALHRAPYIGV